MELTNDSIHIVKNILFPSNTYILEGNNCLLIDPGLDTKIIENKICEIGKPPIGILTTHGHFDHIGSVSYFQKKYDIPFYIHEADIKLVRSANFYLKIAKINHVIEIPIPDIIIEKQEEDLEIGGYKVKALNLPGHSEGSCVFSFGKCIFTGDIIYKNGVGFNNFPGENKLKLKNSILKLISTFSKDVTVFPGHGSSETLGNILETNKELTNFIY